MTIKLFPALVQGVHFSLRRIFSEGAYADKVVPEILKQHPRWGARDRQFVAETTYDLVRWWRTYWYLLNEEPNLNGNAVNDLIALSLLQRGYSLLNPELLGIDDISHLQKKLYADLDDLGIEQSLPKWLFDRISDEFGHKEAIIRPLLKALNDAPDVFLRVNTLRSTREKTLQQLRKDGISAEPVDASPAAIRLGARTNLFKNELYLRGHIEFQDVGSQIIGDFCEVRKGIIAVDVCAGAGGKTIQLAALMQNKGKIYASDKNTHRLAQLHKRAERAGVTIMQIKTIEELPSLKTTADMVLIDAPCSGLGVLRRSPDTKWKLKEETLKELVATQAAILRQHQSLPRVGGCIVYATCSILPSESEQQIRSFLDEQPNYTLEAERRISPADGFDGFYMARLRRLS